MIQVKDLRIGNFIFDDNKVYSKIIGFTPFGHSVRCDEAEGCDILIDQYLNDGSIMEEMVCESVICDPIPLTPEILEKCGFKETTQNNDGSFNMWGKDIDASIDIEEGEVYLYRIHEKIRRKNVIYLHQLQNLYHSLTGEELIYTP